MKFHNMRKNGKSGMARKIDVYHQIDNVLNWRYSCGYSNYPAGKIVVGISPQVNLVYNRLYVPSNFSR